MEAELWELRWSASADMPQLLAASILPGLLVNPAGCPASPPRLLAPYTLSWACNQLTLDGLLDMEGPDRGLAAVPQVQVVTATAQGLQVMPLLYVLRTDLLPGS